MQTMYPQKNWTLEVMDFFENYFIFLLAVFEAHLVSYLDTCGWL